MPPVELSAEDRAFMTPAEIEALTGADAEASLNASGETPPPDAPADPVVLEDGAQAPAKTETAPATTEEAKTETPPAKVLSEPSGVQPELADLPPVQFRVVDKDFNALRSAIEDKADQIELKWSEGNLKDEERVKALRDLNLERSALDREQARAETLAEVNEQTIARTLTEAAAAIAAQSKAAGLLDYTADKKAAVQFDAQLTMLLNDPDNRLSLAQAAQAAHRAVLAVRGITAPTPTAPAPPAAPVTRSPAPPKPRDVLPFTLGGVPDAGVQGAESDLLAQLANLQGEDLEMALAAQPKNIVDKIVRAADATSMGFAKGQGSRRNQARSDAQEAT